LKLSWRFPPGTGAWLFQLKQIGSQPCGKSGDFSSAPNADGEDWMIIVMFDLLTLRLQRPLNSLNSAGGPDASETDVMAGCNAPVFDNGSRHARLPLDWD